MWIGRFDTRVEPDISPCRELQSPLSSSWVNVLCPSTTPGCPLMKSECRKQNDLEEALCGERRVHVSAVPTGCCSAVCSTPKVTHVDAPLYTTDKGLFSCPFVLPHDQTTHLLAFATLKCPFQVADGTLTAGGTTGEKSIKESTTRLRCRPPAMSTFFFHHPPSPHL